MLYNEIKLNINERNTVICRAFNNHSVRWSTLTSDREGRRLIEFAEEAFLSNSSDAYSRLSYFISSIYEQK